MSVHDLQCDVIESIRRLRACMHPNGALRVARMLCCEVLDSIAQTSGGARCKGERCKARTLRVNLHFVRVIQNSCFFIQNA